MKFRLIRTSSIQLNADEVFADYPHLANKVESVDNKTYINIEKADEFLELAKIAGEIVVGENFLKTNEPVIEIYDGCREWRD